MTLDERMEFLQRSIESHDAQIGDLVVSTQAQGKLLDKLIVEQQKTDHKFRELAATMSELAIAVLNHGTSDGGGDV